MNRGDHRCQGHADHERERKKRNEEGGSSRKRPRIALVLSDFSFAKDRDPQAGQSRIRDGKGYINHDHIQRKLPIFIVQKKMDNVVVRRKRMEDIELKRRRLEEMRKERLTTTQAHTNEGLDSRKNEQINIANIETVTDPLSLVGNANQLSHQVSAIKNMDFLPGNALKDIGGIKKGPLSREKIRSFVSVIPTELLLYDKHCQTEKEDTAFIQISDVEEDCYNNSTLLKNDSVGEMKQSNVIDSSTSNDIKIEFSKALLSEEEINMINLDVSFTKFLQASALHTERAIELNNRYDILRDFSRIVNDESKAGAQAAFQKVYLSEAKICKGRPITHIELSSQQPELFLVAYGMKNFSGTFFSHHSRGTQHLQQPDLTPDRNDSNPGLVCLWSSAILSRPECIFYASSVVLSTLFNPSDFRLILGGCYNGQIVLWNMRISKPQPICRTSLTGQGHKQPVFAMKMLPHTSVSSIASGNEMVSLSLDGQLCHWDLSHLSEPVFSTMLSLATISQSPQFSFLNLVASPVISSERQLPHSSHFSDPLNACCMSLYSGENQSLDVVIGSGGGLIAIYRLPIASSEPSYQIIGHMGLITCMHLQNSSSPKYRNLLLTCSIDWSIKLWHLQKLYTPLFEFYNPQCEYISAVQWCPVHPAIFAAITSGGNLLIWNILCDCIQPIEILDLLHGELESDLATKDITSSATIKSSNFTPTLSDGTLLNNTPSVAHVNNRFSTTSSALTKLAWSFDGRAIFVGSANGGFFHIDVKSNFVSFTQFDELRLEMLLLNANSHK